MHDQPTPTEEEQEQAADRLDEEESMRGTGTESSEQPEEESEE